MPEEDVPTKMSEQAYVALQLGMEAEDSLQLARHASQVTMFPCDMLIALQLRGCGGDVLAARAAEAIFDVQAS